MTSENELRSITRGVSRVLRRLGRPAGEFNAQRYFRGSHGLRFYNTGTKPMREFARSLYLANQDRWSVDDAMDLADELIVDPYLETKSVGIEIVARFHRSFSLKLLPRWKRWLSRNHSANWATTDSICGVLIGPLLVQYPELAARMFDWSKHPNLWVRRASVVGLIPLVRKGAALDLVYDIARRLHADEEDLIQKAVGWTLRESGKADLRRLEAYLLQNGAAIPRTTLRYAIERFPARKRQALLRATRPV